jgi:hypothetical protein
MDSSMVSKALVEDLTEIIKHASEQAKESKNKVVSTNNINQAIESVGFKRIKQLERIIL